MELHVQHFRLLQIEQGDETKEEVSYLDIVTYGKLAENCGSYLEKGQECLIEGRLQQRRWDDKETGQKRSKVEIVASSVVFGVRKNHSAGQSAPAPEPPVEEGEIPF